jgi:hypothetical protein
MLCTTAHLLLREKSGDLECWHIIPSLPRRSMKFRLCNLKMSYHNVYPSRECPAIVCHFFCVSSKSFVHYNSLVFFLFWQLKNKEALKYFKGLSEDGGQAVFSKTSVPLFFMTTYRINYYHKNMRGFIFFFFRMTTLRELDLSHNRWRNIIS